MIIEYLGIPGCGKTFHAHHYMESLKQDGRACIDISRFHGMKLWLKVFYKLADYAILFLPRYRQQIEEYSQVCQNCPIDMAYLPISLNAFIRDIVLYSFVYDIFGKCRCTIVNDEGQLHRVVNLIVNYHPSIEAILDVYKKWQHEEHIIYIQTPVEEAFKRIKKRNRHICEMDEMEDDKYLALLNDNYRSCEEIVKNNSDIKICVE